MYLECLVKDGLIIHDAKSAVCLLETSQGNRLRIYLGLTMIGIARSKQPDGETEYFR